MKEKPSYEELEVLVRELQEQQEILKDEISQMQLLIGQSKDGIVILEPNGSVYETNKQFADMLGYSTDETMKLYVWDWDVSYSKEQLLEYMRIIDEAGGIFETKQKRKDGSIIDVEMSINAITSHSKKLILCVIRDRTEHNRAEQEKTALIEQLRDALEEIKTLRGILPICSHCRKIRDDSGAWKVLEEYLDEHSDAKVSHGICPECAKKLYPDYF